MTSNAFQEHPGPIIIGGVGSLTSASQDGINKFNIPLHAGSQAKMSGEFLDKTASTFPTYFLQGRVIIDIINAYQKAEGDVKSLPTISKSVEGKIDFMIGIKHLSPIYQPKAIFQLPSVLTMLESVFENADRGKGFIGEQHKVFNIIRIYQPQYSM